MGDRSLKRQIVDILLIPRNQLRRVRRWLWPPIAFVAQDKWASDYWRSKEAQPVNCISSYDEWAGHANSEWYREAFALEAALIRDNRDKDKFSVTGFCYPCGRQTDFLVEKQPDEDSGDAVSSVNWREQMVCPACGLNARQRLQAMLCNETLLENGPGRLKIYAQELTTGFFRWLFSRHGRQHKVIGSEYLGPDAVGGKLYEKYRHENTEALSFKDASLNMVISNDVFEHIPNPKRAFAECYRVLKPGGVLLVSVPLMVLERNNLQRARLEGGEVENLEPEVYHGNPMDGKGGSLVFTDFGWEIVENLRDVGFKEVSLLAYHSTDLGYLGERMYLVKAQAGS